MAQDTDDILREVTEKEYAYGFVTDIESEKAEKGLNEDIVRFISAKKNEPAWLLEWRLKAFALWQKMEEPRWAAVRFPPIDYQDLHYYAAPKKQAGPKSLDEVDPELLRSLQSAVARDSSLPAIKLHKRIGEDLDAMAEIERNYEKEEKDTKYHRVERAYGSFLRSFTLPEDADGSKVAAEYKDGILKVHLPKSAQVKPKSIEVKVS